MWGKARSQSRTQSSKDVRWPPELSPRDQQSLAYAPCWGVASWGQWRSLGGPWCDLRGGLGEFWQWQPLNLREERASELLGDISLNDLGSLCCCYKASCGFPPGLCWLRFSTWLCFPECVWTSHRQWTESPCSLQGAACLWLTCGFIFGVFS